MWVLPVVRSWKCSLAVSNAWAVGDSIPTNRMFRLLHTVCEQESMHEKLIAQVHFQTNKRLNFWVVGGSFTCEQSGCDRCLNIRANQASQSWRYHLSRYGLYKLVGTGSCHNTKLARIFFSLTHWRTAWSLILKVADTICHGCLVTTILQITGEYWPLMVITTWTLTVRKYNHSEAHVSVAHHSVCQSNPATCTTH